MRVPKDNLVNLFEKAKRKMEGGWFESAEKYYLRIIHIDPSNFEAYFLLGAVYSILGLEDLSKSLVDLSKKIKADNENRIWN